MTRFRRALVVGKFAPLHRGHQLLLDAARQQSERLVILSYAKPEPEGCPAARRAEWLEMLYPDATRLVLDDAGLARWCEETGRAHLRLPDDADAEDVHRRFCAWVLREMLGETIDAVFSSEEYGPGFAEVLGECQQRVVAHVEVDRARIRVPVSGTLVRGDVHAHRHLLDARVYASFVERIALLGGESTGKTTLAAALAERLETVWVPEYGRELWQVRGGELAYADMLEIARTQLARERTAMARANRYVVCDSSPLTTLFYSVAMFGRADPALELLAGQRYDCTFLCESDFPFVQDGTRRDAAFQASQQRWYRDELQRRKIPYTVLTGSVNQRVDDALSTLASPCPPSAAAEAPRRDH